MTENHYQPVFELTRGNTVESIHFGAIAVVTSQGNLIAQHGDPHTKTFLRSTAKPFQALPFVEQEGPQSFRFTPKEIALMCASHSGTDGHVTVVQSLQKKAGISENHLRCGVHPPFHEPTQKALQARGKEPTPNHHNCSGKHSGMLSLARLNSWPLEDYLDPAHPAQQKILRAFAEMCDLEPERVSLGTDGCSAPNFAVPLYNAALAYARMCDPNGLPAKRTAACHTITQAMTSHPKMVAGPDRFDTYLMETTQGRIVAKGGAEGYQGIGLMPGALGPDSPATGIAFKISDGGARKNLRAAVALEILRQLKALSETELEALAQFGPTFPVHSWHKTVVGEGRPCFVIA
ncbi:MAG: asparaginase [Anaerolineales bacterium]